MINRNGIKIKMTRDGLVAYEPKNPITVRFNREETEEITKKKINFDKFDDHCEVAHLEISNNCNKDCKYCYVKHKEGNELSVQQWMNIIKQLHDYGVFSITFGGGEPTLYPGLIQLAVYANRLGLNLGMTTNGKLLPHLDLRLYRKLFRQINVSWHGNKVEFIDALETLFDYDIQMGINYTYSKEYAKDNDFIIKQAQWFGAEVLYLAYKPVIGDNNNVVSPVDVYKVAKAAADNKTRVAVDGPCAGLCLMKKRFCDIDHKGEVFPCSFVRESMGNILEKSFTDIWKTRGEQEKCPHVELNKEAL